MHRNITASHKSGQPSLILYPILRPGEENIPSLILDLARIGMGSVVSVNTNIFQNG